MFKWHDVYGFEPEMWTAFIPQPVVAAVFCYEIKDQYRDMLDQEEAMQLDDYTQEKLKNLRKPHFIKQIVRNACGTIALLHAVANVSE